MFFNLTLISRALSRDPVLKRIMKKVRYFQKILKVYDYSEPDALGRAVPVYRYKFRTKILQSKSDNDSSVRFDLWDFINDVLDGEHGDFKIFDWNFYTKRSTGKIYCDTSRIHRGVDLISYYVITAVAWRHDKPYRSIRKILKKKVKCMSFEKALEYAVHKKNNEILRKLGVLPVHITIGDDSESKQNNILEEDILGAEALFF